MEHDENQINARELPIDERQENAENESTDEMYDAHERTDDFSEKSRACEDEPENKEDQLFHEQRHDLELTTVKQEDTANGSEEND